MPNQETPSLQEIALTRVDGHIAAKQEKAKTYSRYDQSYYRTGCERAAEYMTWIKEEIEAGNEAWIEVYASDEKALPGEDRAERARAILQMQILEESEGLEQLEELVSELESRRERVASLEDAVDRVEKGNQDTITAILFKPSR